MRVPWISRLSSSMMLAPGHVMAVIYDLAFLNTVGCVAATLPFFSGRSLREKFSGKLRTTNRHIPQ
jgi:hypothetical protein